MLLYFLYSRSWFDVPSLSNLVFHCVSSYCQQIKAGIGFSLAAPMVTKIPYAISPSSESERGSVAVLPVLAVLLSDPLQQNYHCWGTEITTCPSVCTSTRSLTMTLLIHGCNQRPKARSPSWNLLLREWIVTFISFRTSWRSWRLTLLDRLR